MSRIVSYLAAFGLLASLGLTVAVSPTKAAAQTDSSRALSADVVGLGKTLEIGMILAIIYFVLTYRLFWGKVRLTGTEGY